MTPPTPTVSIEEVVPIVPAPRRWVSDTGMAAGRVSMFAVDDPQASFMFASDATRRLRQPAAEHAVVLRA